MKARIGLCLLGLFVACMILGAYGCKLNQRLYQHHHPFYDSMSYHEKMFRVISISRDSGFAASLETACFENNTVALPFLIGAAVAPVVSPSRLIGVWIQTGLLYLFLASLLTYLVRIRGLRPATAFAGCLVFLATKCLFLTNGGLTDFRMDLSLYFAFGLTGVWFLASMERPTKLNFLLLGISAAIACLFRATAPIYLLFSLLPLCAVEFLAGDQRKRKFVGLFGAIVIVSILAGWFYVMNFAFLKFYYVDWNTDANAKIPFYEALEHWNLAMRSVGAAVPLMVVCWFVGIVLVTRKQESVYSWVLRAWSNRELDWRIAWLGLAPVVLMVARRAGLNPFVCMPAVFGLVLFLILPCLKQVDRLSNKTLNGFVWTMLCVCILVSATRGWQRHSADGFDTMSAHQQLIDKMLDDADSQESSRLHFGVVHLTDLNTNSLYSTLLFDRDDANPTIDHVDINGIAIKRIHTFSRPAAMDWRMVKGESDDEKVNGLLVDAANRIDYLILPDQKTAVEIETSMAHNYINRYLVPIRKHIVNDEFWVRVGDPVATSEKEIVEIYRRTR